MFSVPEVTDAMQTHVQSLSGASYFRLVWPCGVKNWSLFAYSRFAYFRPKSGVSPTHRKDYIWAQSDVKLDLEA